MSSSRLQNILDLLAEKTEASVAGLAEHFQVTAMTIRRDLSALEEEGKVTRTHGGVMLAAPSVARFDFRERQEAHSARKQLIARAVVQLVEPGMSVILDTGTTTLEVAKALSGIPDLRVLTTSLAIASVLFAHPRMELVLLGGTVSQGSPDLSGPLTEENLAGFRADLALIGADAVDARGLYTRSQAIAGVTRAMLNSAERSYLVADSSKFGRKAFVRFASWKQLDGVWVDEGVGADEQRWLRKNVKRLEIVKHPPTPMKES